MCVRLELKLCLSLFMKQVKLWLCGLICGMNQVKFSACGAQTLKFLFDRFMLASPSIWGPGGLCGFPIVILLVRNEESIFGKWPDKFVSPV